MDNITVSFDISRARLRDVLTTAYEQGIAYWVNDGDFRECIAARDSKGYVTSLTFEKHGGRVPEFAPSVTIAGTRGKRAIVDVIELAKAYGVALSTAQSGYVTGSDDCSWAATSDLSGNFDADTADALVQIALFGKVIYG